MVRDMTLLGWWATDTTPLSWDPAWIGMGIFHAPDPDFPPPEEGFRPKGSNGGCSSRLVNYRAVAATGACCARPTSSCSPGDDRRRAALTGLRGRSRARASRPSP